MRYRWVILIVMLVGFAVLGRFVSPQEGADTITPTPEPTVEATTVPTVDTAGEFDITAWDLDGDGAFSLSEIGPAALAYAESVEFAPGYEFDPYRFGSEYSRMDYSSWKIDSLRPVVVKAQTCSWVQYWLEATEAGKSSEAANALEMLSVLQNDEALGELAGPIEVMLEAAEAGNAERVQEIFTGARCHLTFFVDDSLGPQGDRVLPAGEYPGHLDVLIVREAPRDTVRLR